MTGKTSTPGTRGNRNAGSPPLQSRAAGAKAPVPKGYETDSIRRTGGDARFNAAVTDFPAPPMRAKEAAAWLGVSTRCLLSFARSGELAGVKRGGTWFFSLPALCDFAGVPYGSRAEGR